MIRVMFDRPDLISHALLLDEVMCVSCATPCHNFPIASDPDIIRSCRFIACSRDPLQMLV
jgi:hypothetical protein